MAREASITYEQVAAAAAGMKAEGRKPSLRSIREALGNIGSLTTIAVHLRTWASNQPKESAPEVAVPSSVLSGIQTAISQAAIEAEASIRAELTDAQQMLNDVTAEGERTAAALDAAEGRIGELETANAELTGRLEEAKTKASETEQRHAAELESLKADLQREREAAEQARTELAKAQLRLESMPRLEKDLEDARGEAKANGSRAGEAERKLAGAEASLAAATADLARERSALDALQLEVKEIRAAKEKAEKVASGLETIVGRLETKLELAEKQIEQHAPEGKSVIVSDHFSVDLNEFDHGSVDLTEFDVDGPESAKANTNTGKKE